eukprot:scaffold115913_cov68-Attheya_sp.AAC.3
MGIDREEYEEGATSIPHQKYHKYSKNQHEPSQRGKNIKPTNQNGTLRDQFLSMIGVVCFDLIRDVTLSTTCTNVLDAKSQYPSYPFVKG